MPSCPCDLCLRVPLTCGDRSSATLPNPHPLSGGKWIGSDSSANDQLSKPHLHTLPDPQ